MKTWRLDAILNISQNALSDVNHINYQEILLFEAEREDLVWMIKEHDGEIAKLKAKRNAALKSKATIDNLMVEANRAHNQAIIVTKNQHKDAHIESGKLKEQFFEAERTIKS